MSLLAQLDQKIAANGGLIVSCQPVPDSPLDKPEIVAAMALAAEQASGQYAKNPFISNNPIINQRNYNVSKIRI